MSMVIIMVITKSNTHLLSRESQFSNCFEKIQISAENCEVFAGSFVKPDDSLKFLKYPELVDI
jgi:hypothetical protein